VHEPQTWHHGLIADYWATFNLDAPEVDLYRPYLRSPLLDAGCGAGRLLAPLRELGYDADGCDVSADMVARCRERVPDATLWTSGLHELDPPRRYEAIVVCGVFGLGTTRAQDELAIARLHDALVPGGTLVLDNEELPWSRRRVRDWSTEPLRATSPEGVEFALSSRVDAVDDEDRCVHMTIRAETSDGRSEEHELTMRQWYREELLELFGRNGFASVDVRPGADADTLVYVAKSRFSTPR
jgi:SAM-dependent methyltransferase